MTGGECPILRKLDEGKRLAVGSIKMDSLGIEGNIVTNDDRPIAQRHIRQPLKCVYARLYIPNRTKISANLLLNSRAGHRQLTQRYTGSLGDYGNVTDKHGISSFSGLIKA